MVFTFSSLFQKNVYGASVVIFEGILSFADNELLQVLWNVSVSECLNADKIQSKVSDNNVFVTK